MCLLVQISHIVTPWSTHNLINLLSRQSLPVLMHYFDSLHGQTLMIYEARTHFFIYVQSSFWHYSQNYNCISSPASKSKLPFSNMSSVFSASLLLSRSILHTPRSRVLLGKLTGSQLVKKFPAFYGTQRFITVFTRARHLSLSINPVHAPPSHSLKTK
jgi:hypothetical protein